MICPPSIANPFQLGDMLDVDEQRRVREAEVHRGKKALAARQHHRVGITGEGDYRFFQGPRRLIPEQRRLHACVVPYPRDMYPRDEYDIEITDELSISGPAVAGA
jgi:hypothetical protein